MSDTVKTKLNPMSSSSTRSTEMTNMSGSLTPKTKKAALQSSFNLDPKAIVEQLSNKSTEMSRFDSQILSFAKTKASLGETIQFSEILNIIHKEEEDVEEVSNQRLSNYKMLEVVPNVSYVFLCAALYRKY